MVGRQEIAAPTDISDEIIVGKLDNLGLQIAPGRFDPVGFGPYLRLGVVTHEVGAGGDAVISRSSPVS